LIRFNWSRSMYDRPKPNSFLAKWLFYWMFRWTHKFDRGALVE